MSLQRKTPMRRTGFAHQAPKPAKQIEYQPRPRDVVLRIPDTRDRLTIVIKKDRPRRSEAYRRLVGALPCIVCGVPGFSQCAHPNTGKAMGRKTDDRLSFPLCSTRIAIPGCHALFDQGALFGKDERRAIEPEFGRRTRQKLIAAGQWPKRLPMWEEAWPAGSQ
jgi:hypothetical protein